MCVLAAERGLRVRGSLPYDSRGENISVFDSVTDTPWSRNFSIKTGGQFWLPNSGVRVEESRCLASQAPYALDQQSLAIAIELTETVGTGMRVMPLPRRHATPNGLDYVSARLMQADPEACVSAPQQLGAGFAHDSGELLRQFGLVRSVLENMSFARSNTQVPFGDANPSCKRTSEAKHRLAGGAMLGNRLVYHLLNQQRTRNLLNRRGQSRPPERTPSHPVRQRLVRPITMSPCELMTKSRTRCRW